MKRLILLIFFFVSSIFYDHGFAQSNVWPVLFSLPVPQDSLKDSTHYRIKNETSQFETFQNRTVADYKNENSDYSIQQTLDFYLTKYSSTSLNQYTDISGSILKKKLIRDGSVGIDWSPVLFANRRSSGNSLLSMVDLGPVISLSPFSIPFKVKGGVSEEVWADSLKTGFLKSSVDDYHKDPGFYSEVYIGDPQKKMWGIPLFVGINAYARSINKNGLGIIKSSALYGSDIFNGDSLFLFIGDSLSNGKEVYLGGIDGKPLYSETPWRIAHSLFATGALRSRDRLGLRPAIIYRYQIHSVAYPSQKLPTDDVMTNGQSIIFQVEKSKPGKLSYNGGIDFTWENEDWLFGKTFSNLADSSNRRSLSINLGDNKSTVISSDHELKFKLPDNFAVRYVLHAFKNSKHYPFNYMDNGELIVNQNENDRVNISHHFGALFEKTDACSLETYYEYSKLYNYYYKKGRSGESFSSDDYKIGFDGLLSRKRFSIQERLFGNAEIQDFKFKNVHTEPFLPPTYSRKISSILTGKFIFNEHFNVKSKWIETYNDDGEWYGKEYFDTTKVAQDFKSYYAIESSSFNHLLELSLEFATEKLNIVLGNSVNYVSQMRYNYLTKNYGHDNLGAGYILEPFLNTMFVSDHFYLDSKIERIINEFDKNKWKFEKNWNIHMLLGTEF